MSQHTATLPPLPEGWVWTLIDNITTSITKVNPSEQPDLEFYYIDISSIDNQALRVTTPKKYVGADAPSRARQQVLKDDVIFSTVRTYLKNIAIVPEYLDQQVASTGFCVLRAQKKTILSKYLFYFVASDTFLKTMNAIQRGTSYPAVRDSDLREQYIPLPPLAEQARIVEALETLFTQLDAGVQALKRSQANLQRYRAAVLKAACEGTLVAQDPNDEPASQLLTRILAERYARWEATEHAKGKMPMPSNYKAPQAPDTSNLPDLPAGWVWATVEQLGNIDDQIVLTGPFGSNLGKEDFINQGIPVLTIGCLTDHGIQLDKALFISDKKADELARYRVIKGDILFSRMASVGRVGLVNHTIEGSVINYHIMRLRLSNELINPIHFITYVRGSSTVTTYLTNVNHGATRDGINTSQLLGLPVCIPPLAEQARIVAEVERRLSVVQALEATLEANLARAERLRQSILKQAFSGQLVPQDPRDEPASLLLEQIQAERAPAPKSLKQRNQTRMDLE